MTVSKFKSLNRVPKLVGLQSPNIMG